MMKYDMKTIKEILDSNWRESLVASSEVPSFTNEGRDIFHRMRREGFKSLEDLYPGCLNSKEFASFMSKNHWNFRACNLPDMYEYFGKDAQIEMIKHFSYNNLHSIFPEACEKLENDILEVMTPSTYQELEFGYKEDKDEESYLMIRDEVKVKQGRHGEICEKGIGVCKAIYAYDEGEEYTLQEHLFIPMYDFRQVEVMGKNDTELYQTFERLKEEMQRLPYKDVVGLLDKMKLLPKDKSQESNTHEMSEITEVISDRTLDGIHEMTGEIKERVQGNTTATKDQEQK